MMVLCITQLTLDFKTWLAYADLELPSKQALCHLELKYCWCFAQCSAACVPDTMLGANLSVSFFLEGHDLGIRCQWQCQV